MIWGIRHSQVQQVLGSGTWTPVYPVGICTYLYLWYMVQETQNHEQPRLSSAFPSSCGRDRCANYSSARFSPERGIMDYESVIQSTATVRECFFYCYCCCYCCWRCCCWLLTIYYWWLYDKSRRRSEGCCLDAYHPQNRLGSIWLLWILIRKVNCTLHYKSSIIGAEKRTRSEAREAVH